MPATPRRPHTAALPRTAAAARTAPLSMVAATASPLPPTARPAAHSVRTLLEARTVRVASPLRSVLAAAHRDPTDLQHLKHRLDHRDRMDRTGDSVDPGRLRLQKHFRPLSPTTRWHPNLWSPNRTPSAHFQATRPPSGQTPTATDRLVPSVLLARWVSVLLAPLDL